MELNDKLIQFRTDKGGELYDPSYFQSTGIIRETTAAYTPQLQLKVWGCKAIVKVSEPKRKNLGERGVEYIVYRVCSS